MDFGNLGNFGFQDIPGLLTPQMNDNIRSQMLLSAAAGLIKGGGPSPTKNYFGGIADALQGAMSARKDGTEQAYKQLMLGGQLKKLAEENAQRDQWQKLFAGGAAAPAAHDAGPQAAPGPQGMPPGIMTPPSSAPAPAPVQAAPQGMPQGVMSPPSAPPIADGSAGVNATVGGGAAPSPGPAAPPPQAAPVAAPTGGGQNLNTVLQNMPPAMRQIIGIMGPEKGMAAIATYVNDQQKQGAFKQETDKDGNIWNVDTRTGQKTIALKADDGGSKWGIVGRDQYGQPTYGYTPTREEYAAQKKNAPPAASTDAPDLTGVTGKDYLDAITKQDPKYGSAVRAIIEGRAPYPTGMLLKTPYGQKLAQDVTQADPNFETGNATARVKVRNEFNSGGVGSPAGQISAGNTAIQHAGEMSDALERLKADEGFLPSIGNAGIPYLSKWASEAHNAAIQGTPAGKALNDFMTAKNHFSEEVTKFYAGSAGSEAERTRALANLDAAKSLPELRSAIQTEVNLMQGKVNALQDRWRNGMGPLVDDFPLISKPSQDAIDRIGKRNAASDAPTAAPAAAAPAAIPAPAIEKLKASPTPEMRAHFDEVFGAGAADRVMGGAK